MYARALCGLPAVLQNGCLQDYGEILYRVSLFRYQRYLYCVLCSPYNSSFFIFRGKAIWTYGSIAAASSSDERVFPPWRGSLEKPLQDGMWVRRACEVKGI